VKRKRDGGYTKLKSPVSLYEKNEEEAKMALDSNSKNSHEQRRVVFKNLKKILRIEAIIFIVAFIIYYLSNDGKYCVKNIYVHLAFAFLNGEVSIPYYPYLDGVLYHGNYYAVCQPLPAIILLPFVALWDMEVNQAIFSITIGALNAVLAYKILERLNKGNFTKNMWLTVFFAFGTVHWHVAEVATQWYFAHVCTIFFLFLAILEVSGKKRPILVGFFLAFSSLCRLPAFLSIPFFILMLNKDRRDLKKTAAFFIAFAIPFIPYVYYNYLRFGIFNDIGYLLYFQIDKPADALRHGYLHWEYLPYNLYTFLFMAPEYLGRFPYIAPTQWGMSILFTSPAIIYCLKARIRNENKKLVVGSWVSAILVSIPSFLYHCNGLTQFGFRHALDFMPFLFILMSVGMDEKIDFEKGFLIVLSVLLNLWGVWWWRVQGW
jgi:hypothetical protein